MVDIWLYEDAEHVVNMFVEVRDKHIGINGNFYLGIVNLNIFVDALSPHRCYFRQDVPENTVRTWVQSPL